MKRKEKTFDFGLEKEQHKFLTLFPCGLLRILRKGKRALNGFAGHIKLNGRNGRLVNHDFIFTILDVDFLLRTRMVQIRVKVTRSSEILWESVLNHVLLSRLQFFDFLLDWRLTQRRRLGEVCARHVNKAKQKTNKEKYFLKKERKKLINYFTFKKLFICYQITFIFFFEILTFFSNQIPSHNLGWNNRMKVAAGGYTGRRKQYFRANELEKESLVNKKNTSTKRMNATYRGTKRPPK